ncbi:unnamed protein product, partial [Mesorhabditis belari]|uniref:Neuroendocrine protein 7B2 n=1 Tax=Mesorhabditis belari TaxID=2138241 RepID=A0AAF3FNS9_9BILA
MISFSFLLLLPFIIVISSALDLETPNEMSMMPSGDFIDLMSRDAENVPGPIAFGAKYMTGGAGEGQQQLKNDEGFKERQDVKSDNVLPAYCEPPNPCPVGFTSSDGCLEEFENSAEFSREYQAQQQCLCDQEHMFNCATKSADEAQEALQDILDNSGLHKTMMAKKYHESINEEPRRRKRSVPAHKINPYLQGEPLRSVQKKDGKRMH